MWREGNVFSINVCPRGGGGAGPVPSMVLTFFCPKKSNNLSEKVCQKKIPCPPPWHPPPPSLPTSPPPLNIFFGQLFRSNFWRKKILGFKMFWGGTFFYWGALEVNLKVHQKSTWKWTLRRGGGAVHFFRSWRRTVLLTTLFPCIVWLPSAFGGLEGVVCYSVHRTARSFHTHRYKGLHTWNTSVQTPAYREPLYRERLYINPSSIQTNKTGASTQGSPPPYRLLPHKGTPTIDPHPTTTTTTRMSRYLLFTICKVVPILDAIGNGHSVLLECDKPVTGRYLVLYLNHTGILTICELRVYSRE